MHTADHARPTLEPNQLAEEDRVGPYSTLRADCSQSWFQANGKRSGAKAGWIRLTLSGTTEVLRDHKAFLTGCVIRPVIVKGLRLSAV